MIANYNNITSDLTYEEISRLEDLIKQIRLEKKTKLLDEKSLDVFIKEYLKFIESTFSHKYFQSVQNAFQHLEEFFNTSKILNEITVKDAEDFKVWLIEKVKRGYIVYLRTIRAAFERAVTWEFISHNPFGKIKIRKPQKNKPIFISRIELDQIINRISSYIIKEIAVFSFYTGCRLSELVYLKWNNIDMNKKLVLIGDEDFRTKSAKQRVVPMCKEIYEMLKNKKITLNRSEFVFSKSSGFPYNKDHVSATFKKACRLTNVDQNIHFHTLRHSFASNLAAEGVPLHVVQKLLGHSDISTTMVYSHTNLNMLQQAIRSFDQIK